MRGRLARGWFESSVEYVQRYTYRTEYTGDCTEWDAEDSEETDAASRADFFERVAAAEAEAESAETSSESAESAVSADEPDASLPPKLPEDKPKGKSKWARLKDD